MPEGDNTCSKALSTICVYIHFSEGVLKAKGVPASPAAPWTIYSWLSFHLAKVPVAKSLFWTKSALDGKE